MHMTFRLGHFDCIGCAFTNVSFLNELLIDINDQSEQWMGEAHRDGGEVMALLCSLAILRYCGLVMVTGTHQGQWMRHTNQKQMLMT